MRHPLLLLLASLLLGTAFDARGQDTLVRMNGTRIPVYGVRERNQYFYYFLDADRTQKKLIEKASVYMLRFEDGRTWPTAIGHWRASRYYKRVLKQTGDTALALDRFLLRPAPYDTITLFDGSKVAAYGTRQRVKQIRYYQLADSAARRLPERDVYQVRFASGNVWPPENGRSRQRRFDLQAARQTQDWNGYVRKYASQQTRILITGPGAHLSGEYPGVSVGVGFETFIDSAHRISLGVFAGKMWAGTAEGGELSNGDRRANIQVGYFMPVLRYHLGDMRDNFDPYAGFNLVLANHRRSDTWMVGSSQYTQVPERALMVSPQFELGFNINTASAFTMQFAVAGGPQFVNGKLEGMFGTLALLRLGFRF